MIVRRFAEPDLGQTSIPIVYLVSAYPTYLRPLGIFIYFKGKKISDKYHKSTFSSRCMQCAVSSMCQPAQFKLNCQRTQHNFIIFWYLDEPAQMCAFKTPFIAHCATHNAWEQMMAQSVQLKYHSVLNGLIKCFTTHNHNVEKGPFIYKQTYIAFTSISIL